MTGSDDEDADDKRICHACVREEYLSKKIEATGQLKQCSYCSNITATWSITDLADTIEAAFKDHYIRTPDEPDMWQQRLQADRESDYTWWRDGEPVLDAIESAAEIPRDAATDTLEILSDRHDDYDPSDPVETEFSEESHYEESSPGSGTWQHDWNEFEKSLKTEARLFNHAAANHLKSVFGSIDKLVDRKGRSSVVRADPARKIKHLYRARVFQSDKKLEEALCRPDRELGPPPVHAATAGRMNARGISVFYGATSPETAIAEVRPPVGSKVALAKFRIIKPLLLLDLAALENVQDGGSIFDSKTKPRLERASFLRSLGQRMARPVMPNDESLEYLATQAVADFLATENDPQLDGIIYRSAQTRGARNVVLFHKASKVEDLKIEAGTKIEARSYLDTEDGPEVDYWVSETLPPKPSSRTDAQATDFDGVEWPELEDYQEGDMRADALRIDLDSIEVHWINWTVYRSTKHAVRRHKFEHDTWIARDELDF